MPLSTSAFETARTSSQVFGGSTPAASSASALYQSTGVEELNGIDSSSPSGVW